MSNGEEAIERMRRELAIDLWESYVTKNHAVIDEVDATLLDTDTTDNLINKLREAAAEECQRPKMGRGCLLYSAYEKVIDAACRDIAGRYATESQIESFRRELGI